MVRNVNDAKSTGNFERNFVFTFFDIRLNDVNDDCGDTIRVPESTGTSVSIVPLAPERQNLMASISGCGFVVASI